MNNKSTVNVVFAPFELLIYHQFIIFIFDYVQCASLADNVVFVWCPYFAGRFIQNELTQISLDMATQLN